MRVRPIGFIMIKFILLQDHSLPLDRFDDEDNHPRVGSVGEQQNGSSTSYDNITSVSSPVEERPSPIILSNKYDYRFYSYRTNISSGIGY